MSLDLTQTFTTLLNDEQRHAAMHIKGPLLVVAGAGSGKTRVITARVAYLLSRQIPASSIIVLTFTNKAAQEMKERVKHFLQTSTNLPFIGTFHSYCLKLLKQHYAQVGLPLFSILDEEDKEKMIRRILEKNGLTKRVTPRHVITQLSMIKQEDPLKHQAAFSLPTFRLLNEICTAFEHEKAASNCLDFDDLLHKMVDCFANDALFKEQHQKMVQHILIDEYQDTNKVQYNLVKHMVLADARFAIESICAVGDEDQSIYSWRGATVTNITDFQKDFSNTTIIKVEQNYRTVQPILHLANTVIAHNVSRSPKNLWSLKKATDRIRLITNNSEYQEADAIAECATVCMQHDSKKTVAVLYRTHLQSRAIEEAFIRRSIPYKIIGGVQFYERKEIKDIVAYLRLIVNPFDRVSLLRILNIPGRGLGDKVEEQWFELWHTLPRLPFQEIGQLLIESEEYNLPPHKRQALFRFLELFITRSAQDLPSDTIEAMVQAVHYYEYLKKEYEPEEAEERCANVKELIAAAHHLQDNGITTLEEFLHEVALLQEHIKPTQTQDAYVTLMTMHAAKGLEFDLVILPGLEEGIMPSSRSLFDPDSLEEERRLLYVGITRAREYLLITHAHQRRTFGRPTDQLPSRFLDTITQLVEPTKFTPYYTGNTLQSYFNAWLTGTTPKSTIHTTPAHHNNATLPGAWKVGQLVNHEIYGIGTIRAVEKVLVGTSNLTIYFKQGLKKIRETFIKPL
jgi:DNA helicase II / ATP-dependent DNA helicase PcrA